MRIFISIFILLNLLICCYYIDVDSTANTASRADLIMSYYENNSFVIDKYHQNTMDKSFINHHYYSDKAPLPALTVLPFYFLLKNVNINKVIHNNFKLCLIIGDIICGVLPFVIIILLTFLNIYKFKSYISAIFLSTLPYYGSFLYIFSGTFFAHLYAGAFLLGAYILLKKKRFFYCGFLTGLCFLSEFPLAIAIPLWTFQIFINTKKINNSISFILGVLPSVIFIFLYNYHFTGNPLKMIYTYEMTNNLGFSSPDIIAFWKLLFSQYRGLFFYMPFLIFILFYVILNFKKNYIHFILSDYLIPFAVLNVILISSFGGWYGGWSYGPRYLTAIAILIGYEGIVKVANWENIKLLYLKLLFWILIGFGLICSVLAKSTITYSNPTEIKSPFFQNIIPNLLKHNFNQNNIFTALFNLNAGYSIILWLFIFLISIYFMNYSFKIYSHNLDISKSNQN
jgi:hypothetical protein